MQKQMTGGDDLVQQLLQKLQAQEGFVVQLWPPPELESFPPHPPAHVGAALTACIAYTHTAHVQCVTHSLVLYVCDSSDMLKQRCVNACE